MKTTRILVAALAISMTALPVVAASEAGQTGVPELTLADFQSSGGKPVEAWERYRQYKYRLAHPAPKPTLETSRMRTDSADRFVSSGKPSVDGWKARHEKV